MTPRLCHSSLLRRPNQHALEARAGHGELTRGQGPRSDAR
jgi:hypothetical protein